MTEHPTLIVDGDPADWLGRAGWEGEALDPTREVARVDDPLPVVLEKCHGTLQPNDRGGLSCDGGCGDRPPWGYTDRPLRVDDTVTLATKCPTPTGCPPPTRQMCPHGGAHPFATAKVVGITEDRGRVRIGHYVTVTDVEALP
jgi:hypothetical protein